MTLIAFEDGKPVFRDGKVGTGQACCCGGDCCNPLPAVASASGESGRYEFTVNEGPNAGQTFVYYYLCWSSYATAYDDWEAAAEYLHNVLTAVYVPVDPPSGPLFVYTGEGSSDDVAAYYFTNQGTDCFIHQCYLETRLRWYRKNCNTNSLENVTEQFSLGEGWAEYIDAWIAYWNPGGSHFMDGNAFGMDLRRICEAYAPPSAGPFEYPVFRPEPTSCAADNPLP